MSKITTDKAICRLVLASSSPRRAALLRQAGLNFTTVAPRIDETVQPNEIPADYVMRLARNKAVAGYSQYTKSAAGGNGDGVAGPGQLVVLGADTSVVVDDEILGKPCGPIEGEQMLMRLSGRHHEVVTAVAASNGQQIEACLCSVKVQFRTINKAEARAYLATGEGADKAGGYGIQGIGGIFAERIEGSYSAVVGLPLAQTENLLRKLNIDTWSMRIDG